MANFISRNILICVMPAVIALLSVYWFRKKKRMKSDIFSALHKESFVESKDGLHSHKNILNSPIECSSDFANTLSDASSISSPENSSQSYVSSNDDVSDSIEESDMISNCVDRKSSTCISSLNKVNMSSDTGVCVSSSVTNTKSSENVDNSLVSGVELSFPNSQIKIEFDTNNAKQSIASEKLSFPKDIEDIQVSRVYKKFESSRSFDSSNLISHCNDNSVQEAKENFSKAEDLCLNIKQSAQNNYFQSSNLSEYIYSPNGDPELSPFIEMDSNDSHSSVLDENSLSCISDESESRQVIDFKNKDSPSSVLDENSLCDESERTDISSYATTLQSKFEEINKTNVSQNISSKVEEPTDSCLNVPLLNENNCIKQYRYSTCIDDKVEIVTSDNGNFNEHKNFESSFCITEVNELNTLKLSNKSESDIIQSNSIESVSILHSNLDIPSNDKDKILLSSSDNCEDMSVIESGKSNESKISLCDNSVSVCVHSSNENSDLDTASTVSKETVANDSAVTSDRDSDSLNVALVKEHKNIDSGICSSADESLSSRDVEISERNISSYFNSIEVPSDIQTRVSVFETNQSSTEDSHIIVNQNNVGSDLMDMKDSSHFVYEFDLPQELCGRLIGKLGKHVKSIKERTNANVFIKRHPYDSQLKTVVVEGIFLVLLILLSAMKYWFKIYFYPFKLFYKISLKIIICLIFMWCVSILNCLRFFLTVLSAIFIYPVLFNIRVSINFYLTVFESKFKNCSPC